MANILRSSGRILEDTKFPFTVIKKLATSQLQLDSLGTRLEESFYEFVTYTRQRKQLNQIMEKIRDRFDYIRLQVLNRNVISTLWNGGSISEPETGLYCGKVRYQILAEKLRRSASNLDSVSGANFLECLYNRFKTSNELQMQLTGFYTSKFAPEEAVYPFVTCSDFIFSEDSRHTCGQTESVDFQFEIWGMQAQKVEEIKEIMLDEFDYMQMNLDQRQFYSMLYQGDGLIETEAGIWLGTINYQILQDKAL
jgi:hypothetical protein